MSARSTDSGSKPKNGRITSTTNDGKAGVLRDIVDGADYPFVVDDERPRVHEGQNVIFEPDVIKIGSPGNEMEKTIAK